MFILSKEFLEQMRRAILLKPAFISAPADGPYSCSGRCQISCDAACEDCCKPGKAS